MGLGGKMEKATIKAVLFDFDGTLTRPGALDFTAIKQRLGCPPDEPVLEFIDTLPPERRRAALADLDRMEMGAAAVSIPNDGAEELLDYLKLRGLRLGILSRNSRGSILRALQNFSRIKATAFDVIIARDDEAKPKPSGDGIRLAARHLHLEPRHILMVGDYIFDVEAGRRAGARTVLLRSTAAKPLDVDSDHTIAHLSELKALVRLASALPAGKLPNDLLQRFLVADEIEDPSLLIPPGVGEDVAAVDVKGEEVLVLKSDPITFATDAIWEYTVLVNANDIATSGADPRWLLTTLLFPPGTTAEEVRHIMANLRAVCHRWGITLCGGHTEITDAVTRPVAIGTLAGTVARRHLIDKRYMTPGDQVLFTKAVAVEGTAIIAREFGPRLEALGMPAADIASCRTFLDKISVLPEARLAAACEDVTALHDVTEGGIATAVSELGIAGHHRLKIFLQHIPVFPQTRTICRLLGLDPLGLIGSGSLLICCRPQASAKLIKRLRQAGIQVACIGEVLDKGGGVEVWDHQRPVPWPEFEVDEIARLFAD